LRDFTVNIIGLSNKAHHFDFELNDGFFEKYGKEVVSKGLFDVHVTLEKKETFIDVEFEISGSTQLICDRSLEPFDYPIKEKKTIVFKYGEEAQEISDEIMIITRDQVSLDLGQFVYEFIALSIPIKKVHPSLQAEDEDDGNEYKMIYSTSVDEEIETEDTDPRWEKLKKLK
jgi:uncharacterized metal-binding protein YceD (DUF177 family)